MAGEEECEGEFVGAAVGVCFEVRFDFGGGVGGAGTASEDVSFDCAHGGAGACALFAAGDEFLVFGRFLFLLGHLALLS